MVINSIILKSGVRMDIDKDTKSEILYLEQITVSYKGVQDMGSTKWIEQLEKNIVEYIGFTSKGQYWMLKESDVAAISYEGGNTPTFKDIKTI